MTEIETESEMTEGFDTSMDIDIATAPIPTVDSLVTVGAMKIRIKRVRLFGNIEN